jgi:hypothetical protein
MMKLLALTDYKGRFGSKHFDHPYRSGMDKEKLQAAFRTYGVELFFMPMSSVWQKITRETKFFIYTSIEDDGYLYKSYLEDIVFGLAQKGYVPIPGIAHLRANNNKGMMEFLRQATGDERINTINTQFFGTIEELKNEMPAFSYPVVIKKAAGASGRGVYKASNPEELLKAAQLVSSSKSLLLDLKDWLRSKRHKGYQLDSRFRNKFITQNFIPDLKNDWKVYWFNGELYVFYRPIFAHRDFIASGGGYDNYVYGEEAYKPEGFFEFVTHVMSFFQVPHASMDIAFDGKQFHLLEIQFVYFGTAGIPYSKGYYKRVNDAWEFVHDKREIEEVYAKSVATFLKNED